MSAHANILIISGNGNPLETEALKAIYGNGATFRTVKDANELVGVILSFTSIRRLVIATHGSEGDVIIRGVHTSIAALAQRLQQAPVKTRVTESIVFDGCNVAGESTSLAQFMAVLSAPKLNAFAVSRLWWHDEYEVPKGSDPKAVEQLRRRYDSYKDYLVAGQSSFDAITKRGGRTRVWYEGFSRIRRARPQTDAEKRDVHPRSKLQKIRVARKDAASLASSTSKLGGPMIEVELIGP